MTACVKLLASWSQQESARCLWNATSLHLCSQARLGKFIIPCTESSGENFADAYANGEEQNRDRASEPFLAGFGTNLTILLTGDARWKAELSLLTRKAVGIPGVAGAERGAGVGTAFCSFSKTPADAVAHLLMSGRPGKRQQGCPQLPFKGKASNSEPIIPHALQPKHIPQDCFSLSEETAHRLGLANPTTAGVFRLFSRPHTLFQDNLKWLAWKILAPKADVSFCSIYPLLLHSPSSFFSLPHS